MLNPHRKTAQSRPFSYHSHTPFAAQQHHRDLLEAKRQADAVDPPEGVHPAQGTDIVPPPFQANAEHGVVREERSVVNDAVSPALPPSADGTDPRTGVSPEDGTPRRLLMLPPAKQRVHAARHGSSDGRMNPPERRGGGKRLLFPNSRRDKRQHDGDERETQEEENKAAPPSGYWFFAADDDGFVDAYNNNRVREHDVWYGRGSGDGREAPLDGRGEKTTPLTEEDFLVERWQERESGEEQQKRVDDFRAIGGGDDLEGGYVRGADYSSTGEDHMTSRPVMHQKDDGKVYSFPLPSGKSEEDGSKVESGMAKHYAERDSRERSAGKREQQGQDEQKEEEEEASWSLGHFYQQHASSSGSIAAAASREERGGGLLVGGDLQEQRREQQEEQQWDSGAEDVFEVDSFSSDDYGVFRRVHDPHYSQSGLNGLFSSSSSSTSSSSSGRSFSGRPDGKHLEQKREGREAYSSSVGRTADGDGVLYRPHGKPITGHNLGEEPDVPPPPYSHHFDKQEEQTEEEVAEKLNGGVLYQTRSKPAIGLFPEKELRLREVLRTGLAAILHGLPTDNFLLHGGFWSGTEINDNGEQASDASMMPIPAASRQVGEEEKAGADTANLREDNNDDPVLFEPHHQPGAARGTKHKPAVTTAAAAAAPTHPTTTELWGIWDARTTRNDFSEDEVGLLRTAGEMNPTAEVSANDEAGNDYDDKFF